MSFASIVSARLGRPTAVAPQSMKSYFRYRRGVLYVQPLFLKAPPAVHDAIARYLAGDRSGRRVYANYYSQHVSRLQTRARATGKTATALAGSDPALLKLQKEIGRRYFKKWAPVHIRWGTSEGRSGNRIRLGYYEPQLHRITVNPIYRRRGVPRAALGHTVYHEMLHHDMPATISAGGTREVHTPAFRARERAFAGYAASQKWRGGALADVMRARRGATRRS